MLYLLLYLCIQIVGESFPVSSSGHLALLKGLATIFGVHIPAVTTTMWFNHLLHLPTVIIIVGFFSRCWWRWRIMVYHPIRCKKIIMRLIGTVFIADLLTSITYLVLKVYGIPWWHLAYGFLVTALVLYSLCLLSPQGQNYSAYCVKIATPDRHCEEHSDVAIQWIESALRYVLIITTITGLLRHYVPRNDDRGFMVSMSGNNGQNKSGLRNLIMLRTPYSWISTAIILGVSQSIALLPGISRFAFTYFCARWCGKTAQQSFELSWLIGWPLMMVGALHGLLGLYFCGVEPELLHPMILWIILGATVMAWCALWLMQRMALAGTLYKLAYYMLVPLMIAIAVCHLL